MDMPSQQLRKLECNRKESVGFRWVSLQCSVCINHWRSYECAESVSLDLGRGQDTAILIST